MKFNFSFDILKWLLGLAIASFFISLWLPYIGEEGVYTISSYEMWYHQEFLYPTLFGISYWRPPLFNWFIIFIAQYIGWGNMLVAARLVSAAATIASSFVIMWLAKHLFKKSGFGLFAALIYLTSDALFYHGWLAYADPLFAFFTSSAIALLWVANLERRYNLIWFAVLALIAAFMTKAITTYVFYVLSLIFIVYYNGKRHAFSLKNIPVFAQLLAFSFPFLWNFIVHGITGKAMLGDIFHKFFHVSFVAYIQQMIFFPLEVFSRFLPASILTLYYFLKKKLQKISFNSDLIKTLIGIVFINFIPYWLVPNTGIRYLLPLYPFIALFIAILLWHLPKQGFNIVIIWLSLAVLIKYIGLIFLFYYQYHFRGDYKQVAQQVIIASQGFPLYSNDDVATGLSTTALIDNLLYPHPPLAWPPFSKGAGKDYFVISNQRNSKFGKFYKVFPIGKQGTPIYLLCHGSACNVN